MKPHLSQILSHNVARLQPKTECIFRVDVEIFRDDNSNSKESFQWHFKTADIARKQLVKHMIPYIEELVGDRECDEIYLEKVPGIVGIEAKSMVERKNTTLLIVRENTNQFAEEIKMHFWSKALINVVMLITQVQRPIIDTEIGF